MTRADNRAAIERRPSPELNFIYYDLPRRMQIWRTGFAGKRLYYILWQWFAARHIRKLFPGMPFDVVQHVTYVSVRYPSFMGSLGIPFYFGPVSGGEAVPGRLRKGFSVRERLREWLRDLSNRLVALDPFLRKTFRQADKIIATRDTVPIIPQRWRHKCEVQLAIGLSSEYLNQAAAPYRSGRCFRLLYVGRLLDWKGMDIALRAVHQLKQWDLNVQFTIVGDGSARSRLTKLSQRLGLAEIVTWTGCVPQYVVEVQYHSADLFLFPSLRDSGGLAVLEALAHGLPVVCTDLGGPGVMVNDRCGRVAPGLHGSSEELVSACAAATREIMTTPGLRERLARGARTRALDFNFQHLVRSIYPIGPRRAMVEHNEYALQSSTLVSRGAAG